MKDATLSISEWVLDECTTARAIDRAAAAGYRAIELIAPLNGARAARRALTATGLHVSSISPRRGWKRDCAHVSVFERAAAIDTLCGTIELAGELGAPAVVVVPTDRADAISAAERREEFARAADTIRRAMADTAPGPEVVIEPLNRYETHLVRTLADAAELRRLIDSPSVKISLNLFHANIEEDCVELALRRHSASIRLVHVADNHRRAPGTGHLQLAELFSTLAEVDQSAGIVLEFLPDDEAQLRLARSHVEGLLARLPPPGDAG